MSRSEVDELLDELESEMSLDCVSSKKIELCERSLRSLTVDIKGGGGSANDLEWLQKARARLETVKRHVLIGGNRPKVEKGGSAKDVQVRVNRRIDSQNESLEHSRRTIRETEQVADGILGELASQRQTIQNSRQKLQETNADLGYGQKLLNSMQSWWQVGSIQKK